MIAITFEDRGQPFCEWYIVAGHVVDCRPFMADVYLGAKVHNKGIQPGDVLEVTLRGEAERRTVEAPVMNACTPLIANICNQPAPQAAGIVNRISDILTLMFCIEYERRERNRPAMIKMLKEQIRRVEDEEAALAMAAACG